VHHTFNVLRAWFSFSFERNGLNFGFSFSFARNSCRFYLKLTYSNAGETQEAQKNLLNLQLTPAKVSQPCPVPDPVLVFL